MKSVATILTLLILLTGISKATPAEDAAALVEIINKKHNAEQSHAQIVERAIANDRKTLGATTPAHDSPQEAYFKNHDEVARKAFTEAIGWPAMRTFMIERFIKQFTSEELKQVLSFLSSPAGQKFDHLIEQTRNDSYEWSKVRLRTAMLEVQQADEQYLKDHPGASQGTTEKKTYFATKPSATTKPAPPTEPQVKDK